MYAVHLLYLQSLLRNNPNMKPKLKKISVKSQ